MTDEISERRIPFSPPDISDAEIQEVTEALKSGWITTGPRVKELERLISMRCGTIRAACLNSNTACAELTLRLLGVGPGDEVIVPAYTYSATASVIDHVGATIVMVDCESGKFTMDMGALEDAITEKTKVIIPVDLFGIPADYDAVFDIVNQKKELFSPSSNDIQQALGRIIVMADAAHSFGAMYKGRPAGSVADFTNFSFHAVKNLTTAEGGAATWRSIPGIDNDELYHRYMLYSLHGQSKDALSKSQLGAWEYDIIGTWYKCNMTDVHAAIGLAQIRRYDDMLLRRGEILELYQQALSDLPISILQHHTDDYRSSCHLCVVRMDGKTRESRDEFIAHMAQRGVSTNVHYKPLPMHTAYKRLGFDIADYPNAEAMFNNEVTLPLHTCLSDDDVAYICKSVRESFEDLD